MAFDSLPAHCRLLVLPVTFLLAAPPLGAQTMLVTNNPVPPGALATVLVVNNGPNPLLYGAGTLFHMISPGGDLIAPDYTFHGDTITVLGPGQSVTLSFQVPASGPGSWGSAVLYFPAAGLVAPLHVGAVGPLPAITTFPARLPDGFTSHAVAFTSGGLPDWTLVNVSGLPHTLGPGDALTVFAPGGATPLASVPLGGITVPAGGEIRIAPFQGLGLTPGPYTAQVSWADPLSGPQVRRIGIRDLTNADVHLPGGRLLPLGGTLPVRLGFHGVAVGQPATPVYVVLVGWQPGTWTLPGGAILPLTLEPLVLSSALTGLGGTIINHAGTAASVVACGLCPPHPGTYLATGPALSHPGPALSGLTFRLAAAVFEPVTGLWGASQPEEITLQ